MKNKGWRKKLSSSEKEMVDVACDWFDVVKDIRDILMHRPYTLQVNRAFDGIAFGLYQQAQPIISVDIFHVHGGSQLVDLDLHLGWLLAEFLVFADKVVKIELTRFEMTVDQLPRGARITFPLSLLVILQSLHRRAP